MLPTSQVAYQNLQMSLGGVTNPSHLLTFMALKHQF